ncbi:SDR family oxidoreductase [Pseudochelatococcus contaminans]|uniref:3-oxoacyl-[acyl-carrier protein] reductase n=1 Tax=Pseudochelatococcus contaminans TaxID=1538103 RepID=A0A7W6EI06_9HYPH|nr:SDR family oxidoreductase [Pseudochelatococcus contaminans]MBB3810664.1 3-oxoacyl-[acyl-carrier protein] reductase [Pseudochelatococcus contaminans]
MKLKFRDKVILVTGASRGIGAAIAKAFAAEGGLIIVNYRTSEAAALSVVDACRKAGGEAIAIAADVTDSQAVAAMAERIGQDIGRLDVVVNNAFAPYRFDPEQRQRFPEISWGAYRAQFDGAVGAAYAVCRAMLPLLDRGQGASIVNIVSDLVAQPSIPYHDYTTAKAALIGFSRNLAGELGPQGIRVNCVAPGLVHPTDSSAATKEDVRETLIAQTPLRRLATPNDVAGAVLFLASEWSGFVTGQTLHVDGGLVME